MSRKKKIKRSKKQLLSGTEKYFRDVIIKNHIQNIKKCSNLNVFKVNPFIHKYLAGLVGRQNSKISLAKALILPRCLGNSIATSVGTNFQKYIIKMLGGKGSDAEFLDFDFRDKKDRKKKSCQLKAGPNCLNSSDVKQLIHEFRKVTRRTRTNFGKSEIVAGVAYGEPADLSPNYKKLQKEGVQVYIGKEFWHRVTGDKNFYAKLIKRCEKAATQLRVRKVLNETIKKLSNQL